MKIDTEKQPNYTDTPIAGMQCYQQPFVSLYNEDCIETMKRIPDGSIDLMLTDPPYNTTACEWDVAINLSELWAEWERILKPDGLWVFTTSQPFTSELILSRKIFYKCEWIWDKALGGNSMTVKYMPYKIHENIIVFGRGKTTYNPIMEKGVNRLKNGKTRNKDNAFNVNGADYKINDEYYPQSILKISNAQRTGRIHPTQKPVDLIRYLILTYSNKGETIFDGYSGSGTTAEACIIEGRKFIGSELNKEYFDKSVSRLKNVPTQLF